MAKVIEWEAFTLRLTKALARRMDDVISANVAKGDGSITRTEFVRDAIKDACERAEKLKK